MFFLVLLYNHNLVLVFGGTGFPFGHAVSNDLHILDLKRRQWRRCQFPNNPPAPVYGAVCSFQKFLFSKTRIIFR